MKVLHIYRDLLRNGGIPHQTRRLIEGQVSLGYEIATFSLNGVVREEFSAANPSVNVFVTRESYSSKRDLLTLLRSFNPDIVHITGLWIPIQQLWAWAVNRWGVPYVVSTHGNLSPQEMKVRFGEKKSHFYNLWAKCFWQRCLDIPLLKNAAGVHAHSRYEEELLRVSGIQKIFVAPAGVDSEHIAGRNPPQRSLHNPITFLHLGRLDIYHKGLDLVCEVIEDLAKVAIKPKYKIILMGPGVNDSDKKLEKNAHQLGNEILEIREPLWGAEKEKIWLEVDYFLNLYRYAGMARAPSEAIAHGIPLLASREGNFGDWVSSAQMGFVIPLERRKFRQKFLDILGIQETEYQCLSENARNYSREHTWSKVACEVVSGYHQIFK